MIVVCNKIIPAKGFSAINLFGVIFTRKEQLPAKTLRHEAIHTAQMRELAYLFFYVWYGIEYAIRLVQYRSCKEAYRNILFEREAYQHDEDAEYTTRRKYYAFLNLKKNREWQV